MNVCVAYETLLCVTTKKVRVLDGQTPDKVIPTCRYASGDTKMGLLLNKLFCGFFRVKALGAKLY